jgi:putative ATP-binding cassette transporter
MIGVILFVFPLMFPLSTESLIGYVVVLLYMMSPIWGIIGILPTVERGQVAFENIQRLGVSLDNSAVSRHSVVPPVTAGQLESLTLESVTFQYAADSRGSDPFSLGPISLKLFPGELSFVIGGNGSGKSTRKASRRLVCSALGRGIVKRNPDLGFQPRLVPRAFLGGVF